MQGFGRSGTSSVGILSAGVLMRGSVNAPQGSGWALAIIAARSLGSARSRPRFCRNSLLRGSVSAGASTCVLPCRHLTPDLKCLARCLQHPTKNHCIAEPTRADGNKRETGGVLSHPGGSVGALCDITEGPHMLSVDLLLSFFIPNFVLYSKFCVVVF